MWILKSSCSLLSPYNTPSNATPYIMYQHYITFYSILWFLQQFPIHRFRYTLAIYRAFSEPWCWVRKVALAVWIPHIWCDARNITMFELSFWTFMKYVITLNCDICMHRYPNIVKIYFLMHVFMIFCPNLMNTYSTCDHRSSLDKCKSWT